MAYTQMSLLSSTMSPSSISCALQVSPRRHRMVQIGDEVAPDNQILHGTELTCEEKSLMKDVKYRRKRKSLTNGSDQHASF